MKRFHQLAVWRKRAGGDYSRGQLQRWPLAERNRLLDPRCLFHQRPDHDPPELALLPAYSHVVDNCRRGSGRLIIDP